MRSSNSGTQEARRVASARGLTTPEFENVLPRNLFAIADATPSELGQLSGARRELIENHFSARLRQGFDLAEIIEEIAILGRYDSGNVGACTGRTAAQHPGTFTNSLMS